MSKGVSTKRRAAIVIAACVAVFGWAQPVLAGGSWLDTTKGHYEPGDHVVAAGYVQDGSAVGPFLANLGLTPISNLAADDSQTWLALGEVAIEDSGLRGYLANRVSFEFDVPSDLPPGEYMVAVRNADDEFFGDLIGLTLYVGEDPGLERWIEWPLDEPLIADLAPEDVISGPGWSVTVADLLDGQYPADAANFVLDPDSLPAPPVVEQTVAESSTTTTTTTTTTTVQASTTSEARAEPLEAQSPEDSASQAVVPATDGEANQPAAGVAAVVLAVGLIAFAGLGWRVYSTTRSAG